MKYPGAREAGGVPVQQGGSLLAWGTDILRKMSLWHFSVVSLKISELCFMVSFAGDLCVLSGSDVSISIL